MSTFICPFCNQIYDGSENLTLHLKEQHVSLNPLSNEEKFISLINEKIPGSKIEYNKHHNFLRIFLNDSYVEFDCEQVKDEYFFNNSLLEIENIFSKGNYIKQQVKDRFNPFKIEFLGYSIGYSEDENCYKFIFSQNENDEEEEFLLFPYEYANNDEFSKKIEKFIYSFGKNTYKIFEGEIKIDYGNFYLNNIILNEIFSKGKKFKITKI